ncbi:SGNH/GDSL hydrolase family protein [Methylocapsa aurea]|uniref:SGNH/GDSL hydrolase family protein n=1 Tax=Methylocapsa aurea TaxID=663610 RepID=UPI00192E4413|nr:SGNH/GDSL hydrolase family protein [Methylocapsa aurea]
MGQWLSFTLRLAAIPLLLGAAAFIELKQPLPYFRLFTFTVVFFLLADIASLARGKSRDFLLVLASLAFGISLIEAGANFWEPRKADAAAPGAIGPKPIVGWGPDHAGRFHALKKDPKTGAEVYSVDYTIDQNLLRQTRSCESGPTIVFFGCSYTFGDGVNDADTLPQQFADLFDHKQRVLNLGFSGYGPQQFLREIETGYFDSVIGAQSTVFVFLTAAWHAERTACKSYWTALAPRYALENDQVMFKGACNEGMSLKLRQWLENAATYRVAIEPFRHKLTRDDVELYIRVLLAAANLAKEKYGVATLIPYIQVSDDYLQGTGFSNETIMRRLREGGAIVLDVSLKKEQVEGAPISIVGDGHPTGFANRARAIMLKTYIEGPMSHILPSLRKAEASQKSAPRTFSSETGPGSR